MESNPVTTAKSTTADSSSASSVEIFDGNSSPQKIENTPVTTAEDTNGDSLSPVAGAEPVIDARKQMENKPVTVVEVSDDSSSVKVANKDCLEIRKEKMESRQVIAAKAASDYSQGKMDSNPVTTAKSTSADFSSPSPVEIFDGNSSPQKIENTPVTTAEDTDNDSLSSAEDTDSDSSCLVGNMASPPSFMRPNRESSRGTMNFSVSGIIVIIRPRAYGDETKDDEKIPEELAVCKFCCNIFAEENVLKTKCNCKTSLVHDKCASHHFNELGNNMCKVCDQEVETIPVILLRRPFSTKKNKEESKIQSFVLRLKRYFWGSS